MFNVRGGRNVLIENLTLDQGPKRRNAAVENTFVLADGLEIWDVEIAGFNAAGAGSNFSVYITDPNARG
jgi:hypothetical protein